MFGAGTLGNAADPIEVFATVNTTLKDDGGHSYISTRTPPFDPTCWEICGGTPRGLPRWCWVCLVLDSRGGVPLGGYRDVT